jgi:hypothetical protein
MLSATCLANTSLSSVMIGFELGNKRPCETTKYRRKPQRDIAVKVASAASWSSLASVLDRCPRQEIAAS